MVRVAEGKSMTKKPTRGISRTHTRVKTARGRTVSSARWLERQLNDPYVQRAKAEGYRSRAAYKLIEMDQACKLLKKGACVIDLGAAPGGWTQVAVAKAGPGNVIGLDILPMEPLPGAVLLEADFTEEAGLKKLEKALRGRRADVVLSDMAAPTTGHGPTDHLRIMALCEMAYVFACDHLNEGGAFVAKIFRGGTERELLALMKQRFKVVKHHKPPASRSDSSEMYVVATGFRADL